MPSSHVLSTVEARFDDTHAVANAGLLLPAILADRLGIAAAADRLIKLGRRAGAANVGRKLLTVVHAMCAGAVCIDDVDVLRTGATSQVLGHRVAAPSTIGTWLRSFTFGHVRQLDQVTEHALTAAWAAGAGPDAAPIVVDADSTITEVYGQHKQGAAYGYTRVLGLHPLLATLAGTGEILHARQRTGKANTARGIVRFVQELLGRLRRAGASGRITFRADSGFYNHALLGLLDRKQVDDTITVRSNAAIRRAITAIGEDAWTAIDYPDSGIAEVAATRYQRRQLVVHRVRHLSDQGQLFPTWQYHAFVTSLAGDPVTLDAFHHQHATVELAIRDLKAGAGGRCPSGQFAANAAWLALATLAHNLLRWPVLLAVGVAVSLHPRPAALRAVHLTSPNPHVTRRVHAAAAGGSLPGLAR
jgi:Transposase DDE domain group 1